MCEDFQLALSIGLAYLPLAEQTISSLERWSRSKTLNLANFYDQILPYLDDFLRLSYDQGRCNEPKSVFKFFSSLSRSGDDVNVRAVVSNLQEKTRLHSKSRHLLPTRMMKKTKQIKHVYFSFSSRIED